MEFTAKLITFYPAAEGQNSQGKPWIKQAALFETLDRYPRKICVEFWNDSINKLHGLQLNQTYQVSVSLESREYNNRWYHNINGLDVRPATQNAPSVTAAPAPVPVPVATPAPAAPSAQLAASLYAPPTRPAPVPVQTQMAMPGNDDDLPF